MSSQRRAFRATERRVRARPGAARGFTESVRAYAFLRTHAPADAGRPVCNAEVRRQSRRRRLEAAGLPGPAHLLAALRLLRPRLPGLRPGSHRATMTATYRLSQPVDFA